MNKITKKAFLKLHSGDQLLRVGVKQIKALAMYELILKTLEEKKLKIKLKSLHY